MPFKRGRRKFQPDKLLFISALMAQKQSRCFELSGPGFNISGKVGVFNVSPVE